MDNDIKYAKAATLHAPQNIAREKAAIIQEVNELEGRLSLLHEELTVLADTLAPILSGEAIDSDPRELTINPPAGSSTLYYHLTELSSTVRRACDRVADLNRRAEV